MLCIGRNHIFDVEIWLNFGPAHPKKKTLMQTMDNVLKPTEGPIL
jgi:hypothetical protein